MTTLFDVTPVVPAATTAAGPRPAITITVHGLPAPQGSKRHVGRGVMIESSKKVKPWRQDVKHAALAITEALSEWTVLDGPLAVAMTFTFDRPKGHYRTGRNAHLLRDAAPTRPAGMPDLSKLARSTEDALAVMGWSATQIARESGLSRSFMGDLMADRYQRIPKGAAEAVAVVFRARWQDRGPSSIARTVAARNGWVSVWAWDDIDDPAEEPSSVGTVAS